MRYALILLAFLAIVVFAPAIAFAGDSGAGTGVNAVVTVKDDPASADANATVTVLPEPFPHNWSSSGSYTSPTETTPTKPSEPVSTQPEQTTTTPPSYTPTTTPPLNIPPATGIPLYTETHGNYGGMLLIGLLVLLIGFATWYFIKQRQNRKKKKEASIV